MFIFSRGIQGTDLFQARHPELKYPAASTASMAETDSTVILPHHFQQVYRRVQVALEQSRSNPAPAVECSNESRTMTSAGIHPFTSPATISSSTATFHPMSHNATNIQQRSTTTKRQGPSKPSAQSSNTSRVVNRGSSSNPQVCSALCFPNQFTTRRSMSEINSNIVDLSLASTHYRGCW
jgi:hypothetical protein